MLTRLIIRIRLKLIWLSVQLHILRNWLTRADGIRWGPDHSAEHTCYEPYDSCARCNTPNEQLAWTKCVKKEVLQ